MLNEQISDEPEFKFSEILGAMREAVIVVGEDMRIRVANDVANRAFSKSEEGLKNSRLSEVIRDFVLHDAYERAIQKGRSSEIRLELLDDGQRAFNVLITPLNLGDERAAAGIFYDLSHIEKLERVRQEFLSNVSHELRTPLTSILAFVETLESGGLEDESNNKRFLEVIRKNAERMRLLVDEISELSSIESGNSAVEPRRVNCGDIVDDVVSSLSAAAKRREVVLVSTIPKETMINADPVRLQQMMTNLTDNAIKFNRHGGTVTIKHEKSVNGDILTVSDTGEGILKEHQLRIFERFYRVDKARSREIGGTGLGLAIVKHLARQHGGEVSVSSVAGVGTTFHVFLPTHKPAIND